MTCLYTEAENGFECSKKLFFNAFLVLLPFFFIGTTQQAWSQSNDGGKIVLEDFESYDPGFAPNKWKRPHKKSRSILDLPERLERDQDYVEVYKEEQNNVLKVYAKDDSEQILLLNDSAYKWDLGTHPNLSWKWKAVQLPEGAREDVSSKNDSGAALYVTFDSKDWLGRPKTIKYVYSSTLSVGEEAKYGALKVIVASSAKDTINEWVTVKRNVREDYRRLFGKKSGARPGYVMVWSDSDNTNGVAEVYFDDITIGN